MLITVDATATFTEFTTFSKRTIRNYWKVRRNITNAASDAFTAVKRDATEHVIPAIAKGAGVTLRAVDGTCTKANKATVAFLVKYPGIAMMLSPQTIVRMAVAEHYKEMAGQPPAGSHLGDAIDNVEQIAVNIMQ
jgi:hypothetical protein